jgi:hypothetical protein
MKKTLFAVLALVALGAQAQTNTNVYGINYQTTVATGGAIDTGVMDLRRVEKMTALLGNASGANARVLVFKCLAKDGTTALYTAADQSVEVSTQELASYDPRISSVTAETKQVKYPILPCAKGQFTVAAAGAAAGVLQVLAPVGKSLTINYEKTVAAGAILNSDVLDTSRVSEIGFLVDNSAGAGARDAYFKCYANDGTTVLYTSANVSVSNAAPGNAFILLSDRASAATAATRETIYPFPPCKKMSFHVAAAGGAAVGIGVYGR